VLADRIVSLLEDQVDVGLRIGVLPDTSMMATRVGATRRVVCASPAYLAARGTPEVPEAVTAHDCVCYTGFAGPDAWRFVRDGAEILVPVRARLTVASVEAACDAARAGIGLTTAFSYHVAAAIEAGALTKLLDDFQPPALPINLVYTAGRFLPLKLRAFLDFAAPRLRRRLDEPTQKAKRAPG
jgi:DNA-binding transcriptional LysR family regulator